MSRLFSKAVIIFLFANTVFSNEVFTVRGKVLSEASGSPIPYVRVEAIELKIVTYTDSLGIFEIYNIPRGNYTLKFSCEGFLQKVLSINFDSLSSNKELLVRLSPFESSIDTIDVRAEYFKKNLDINTSYDYAVYDEIRKTPGAVEDIIKYFQSSPGVSQGNDEENDIISRGGSPIENLTLIDGIEIENPNHYGPPGSTSGVLSYINLKMIQEADFYSGGFPVKYGERLSSVLDIKFKEGSKTEHIRDLNLSMTGFGGFFEGPISPKSSYMLSIRRSYLELLKGFIVAGNPSAGIVLPNYWDVNLKLNYDLAKNKKLSFAGVFAIDKAKYVSTDNSLPVNLRLLTYGFNYSSKTRYSDFKLILSHNFDNYAAYYDFFNINILQHQLTLKADFNYYLTKDIKLDLFGGDKYIFGNYNVYAYYFISYTGYLLNSIDYKAGLNTHKIFNGFNITWNLFSSRLVANAGVRTDYHGYMTDGFAISPRAGLTYKLTDKTFLNFNIGYFRQAPEFLWLLSTETNKKLSYINSSQTVIGAEHFFLKDLRINLEAYYKFYTGYPVSVYNPYYMFIYGLTGMYPDFLSESLSKGRGYFTGIDLTVQKKNSGEGFYGFFTYSYTKSKFYAMAGGPQPSGFDYGNQFTLIAGWKLPSAWAFSMRVKYYDGKPYTPFDSVASVMAYRGVFDMSKYMQGRMPYYLRIDARIDKVFDFGWSVFTFYVEVQNILDRRNVWIYDWSNNKKKTTIDYQWPRLPIVGASYRF
jgi:hypothetical protein